MAFFKEKKINKGQNISRITLQNILIALYFSIFGTLCSSQRLALDKREVPVEHQHLLHWQDHHQ